MDMIELVKPQYIAVVCVNKNIFAKHALKNVQMNYSSSILNL